MNNTCLEYFASYIVILQFFLMLIYENNYIRIIKVDNSPLKSDENYSVLILFNSSINPTSLIKYFPILFNYGKKDKN